VSAAPTAAEVSRGAATAAVLARLLTPTVRAAMTFGSREAVAVSGVSAGAAALARDAVKAMALAKLKAAALRWPMPGAMASRWRAHGIFG